MEENNEKITFPFKPNERVKAAFKQEHLKKEIIRIMTESLIEAYTNITVSPWEILVQEHPKFKDIQENLVYNNATNSICIKTEKWKKQEG